MADSASWISVLLPGGVGVALMMGIQAIQSWRKGREQREESVLKQWQNMYHEKTKQLTAAQQEISYQESLVDYWRNQCGSLTYLLSSKYGETVPKEDPPKPPTTLQPTEDSDQ